MEPNIAPLAKRLAEENNVNWRGLSGSGSDGRIIERDVLEYLAKVMAGEESVNPTAEPVPEGMDAWPEEDVKGFFESQAGESQVSDSDTSWPSFTETDTLDQLEKEQQELKKTKNHEAFDAEAEAEDLLKKSGVFDLEDDTLETKDESSIFEKDIFITESDVEFDESILSATEPSEDVFDELKVDDLSEDVFLLDENTEVLELDQILDDSPETEADEISNLFSDATDEVKSEDMLIDKQLETGDASSLEASGGLFSSEQDEIDDDLASLFVDPDEDELMELSAEGESIAQTDAITEEAGNTEVFADAEEIVELEEISETFDDDLQLREQQAVGLEESDDDVYNVLSGDEELQLEAEAEEMLELESLEESLDIEQDGGQLEAQGDSDLELTVDDLEEIVDEDISAVQESDEIAESLDDGLSFATAAGAVGVAASAGLGREADAEVEEVVEAVESEASDQVIEDFSEDLEEELEIEVSETYEQVAEELIEENIEVETSENIDSQIVEEVVEETIEAEAEEPHTEETLAAEQAEMSEVEEIRSSLVAKSSQVIASQPSMSYGVLLRRHLDLEKLVDAQKVISVELGSEVEFAAFLLKAAAKAARHTGLVDAGKLGKVNFAGKGISIDAINNAADSFGAFVAAMGNGKSYEIGSEQIELVVADMSALEVDEVVLNVVAPVLSLGRINHSADGSAKSTLSISGDISVEAAAKFMAVVAELLSSPIRLLV